MPDVKSGLPDSKTKVEIPLHQRRPSTTDLPPSLSSARAVYSLDNTLNIGNLRANYNSKDLTANNVLGLVYKVSADCQESSVREYSKKIPKRKPIRKRFTILKTV